MVIQYQLLIVVLFFSNIAFSQNDSGRSTVAPNLAIPAKSEVVTLDTLEVSVKNIAFITKDTTFNCFMTLEPTGVFRFFVSAELLGVYTKIQTTGGLYYKDDRVLGTGNFIKVFKNLNTTDSVYSYRITNIVYYSNGKYKVDNIGIPLLEYDLEHSYILQQMNQNISHQFVYSLINSGTKKFVSYSPSIIKKSMLLKVDLSQDTTFNFFLYETESQSYSGIQLVKSDSMILPLKKMKRTKYDVEQLMEIDKSNVYWNNAEITQLVIIGDKRFVVSYDSYLYQVDRWVNLVENVSGTLKRLKSKF